MNIFRSIAIQLLVVLFITGCSSILSTPTIKPLDTATPISTVVPTKEQIQFMVTATDARVRQSPNTSSKVIFYLAEGQLMLAHCSLGPDGNWCQVTLNAVTRGDLYPQSSKVRAEDFPNSSLKPNFTLKPIPPTLVGETGWVWGGCLGIGSDCK
jgi:hypothetical protein